MIKAKDIIKIIILNNNILNNDKYKNYIDTNTKNMLKNYSLILNKDVILKNINYVDMAELFNIDKYNVRQLYLYYYTFNDIDNKLTIQEFIGFINDVLLNDENTSSLFDENIVSSIKSIIPFLDKDTILKRMNTKSLSQLLNIDENNIINLLLLKRNVDLELTIKEFVETIYNIKNNTNYLNNIDISNLLALKDNNMLMESSELYNSESLSNLLNVNDNSIYYLYSLIDYINNPNLSISLYDLVGMILNDNTILSSLECSDIANLKSIYFIMDSVINNYSYTVNQMSENFNIDVSTTKNIYILYLQDNLYITPYKFVSFILNHKNDDMLDGVSNNLFSQLNLSKNVMDSVLENKKYTKEELASFLGMKLDNIKLIYSLYDINNNKQISISIKELVELLINNKDLVGNIDKINYVNSIINDTLNNKLYSKEYLYSTLSNFSDEIDKDLIKLLYIYYGSENNYNEDYVLTIEEFVHYLNNNILKDNSFNNYIDSNMKEDIINSKDLINDAKEMLVGKNYSRLIINSSLDYEDDNTFKFIESLEKELDNDKVEHYIIGDSPMAYEMSKTFQGELNLITILTMLFIFAVVLITFKSLLIPIILVLIIQSAVFLTMGILSIGGSVYFISILIVQSILMGATIDYAIVYTSYYLESRNNKNNIKDSIVNAYKNSIHTILTSASILVIVTLIVGFFASDIAGKICMTLSIGTLCSALLIIVLLPGIIAACDKFIVKNRKLN